MNKKKRNDSEKLKKKIDEMQTHVIFFSVFLLPLRKIRILNYIFSVTFLLSLTCATPKGKGHLHTPKQRVPNHLCDLVINEA